LTAWTSTQWPLPGHFCTLCGWLFPGPYIGVLSGAPRLFAMPAAVCPLPYRFETFGLAPTVVCVLCAVAFVGFTPAIDGEFWLALPPPFAVAPPEPLFFAWPGLVEALPPPLDVVLADDVLSFPGAFAEFPGAGEAGCVAGAAWELPLPLPWPAPFP
jgi:hypothetical protein